MIHLGDITQIHGDRIEPVDVITFGSPCQDLSVAGPREGLAGERSGLFSEAVRIIREMREATDGIYPNFAVWENVPGALSSNGGEDFRTVLEELARAAEPGTVIPRPAGKWQASGCVMGDGWSIAWRILDAQFWGVPQRRRRIALVVDFAGGRAPEILYIRKGLQGDYYPGGEAREKATLHIGRGFAFPGGRREVSVGDRGGEVRTYQNTGIGWWNESSVGATVRTPCGGDAVMANIVVRKECASFMAGQGAKAGGIAYTEDGSPTLKGAGSGTNQVPCVVFDARGNGDGSVSPTMTGDHQNRVRRLTPLECERLQGYPDGWTDIPDTVINGKLVKTSDSAKYRALGNSIAIPPFKWVLKRVSAQFEWDATLGSLFDGIGGFPYIWEQFNGKGSARWASEIEPFRIAVTRYHFGEADDE